MVNTLALLWCSTARAEVTLDLDWQAPPGCPSAEVVQKRVRSIAGDAWSRAERLHAEGRIVRSRTGRYHLTLKLREEASERERTMESDSCADLAGAAAVVLGLLLRHEPEPGDGVDGVDDASGATTAAESQPTSTARASTPSKPPGASSSPPPPARRTEASRLPPSENAAGTARGIRLFVRVPELTLGFGAVPGTSVGFGAAVGIRFESWRAAVRGRIVGDRTWWATEPSRTGADVSRVEALLEVCRGFPSSLIELAPCVAIGVERLTAQGAGTDVTPRSAQAFVPLMAAGGTAHLYLFDWVALVASAGIRVHATRPEFLVNGFGPAGRLGFAEVSCGLGSEWIF